MSRANGNGTARLEQGISSIVRVASRSMDTSTAIMLRRSFVKLMPYSCRSKTLRNTLDIMHKKGLIVSDKVASKCVIELSNAFDDVMEDVIGDDNVDRTSVQQFEALLCKAITYICRFCLLYTSDAADE